MKNFAQTNIKRFDELLAQTNIPRMAKVAFDFARGTIRREQINAIVTGSLQKRGLAARVKPGQRIAVAVGSREINNLDEITRAVVDWLKALGAQPFIFPAMGSHGGAEAEGQREILAGYGVMEKTMDVPILASMDVVKISETSRGLGVFVDKFAHEADGIVVIGRIKPHTNFHGRIESGLLKMLTVGCGKQAGADICHANGFDNMSENVAAIAHEIIRHENVLFGIGIIEDAMHGTYEILAVPSEKMEEEEPALLVKAKSLIHCIPFQKIDVLIVDEIGKDISGTGMDMNVTGRSNTCGITQPFVERIAVLDLSEKSHHNCCGIGGADVTTKRFYDKVDFVISYPNALMAHDPENMKLPMVMPNDRNAIQTAIHTCLGMDESIGCRIVWMHNTLCLDTFYISESLLPEAERHPALRILSEPMAVPFDADGNVAWL